MSHEIDQSTGRDGFAYVGQPAWHGLGNKISLDADLQQWQTEAGLNWTADVIPLIARTDEQDIDVDSNKALVRSDTKSVLSVVSKNYKVVNPSDVMEFFKNLVEGVDAGFTMETAGCLRGGKKIFALAKGKEELDLGGDKTGQYLLMATSFDRSLPTIAMLTSIRVVCSNTLHLATSSKENGVRITHNRRFDSEKIKEELGITRWQLFAEQCTKFADKQMSDNESREFVARCIAASNPHKTYEDYLDKGEDDKTFASVLNTTKNGIGQDTDAAKNTLFGSLQGITRWIDHDIKSKNSDNRIDSSLFGRGSRVKRFAYDLASTMVV